MIVAALPYGAMNGRPRLIPSLVGLVAGWFISTGIYHMMLTGSCSTPAGPGEVPCPPGTVKYFFYIFFGIIVAVFATIAGGSFVSFAAIFGGVGLGAIRAYLSGDAPDGSSWYLWFGAIFLAAPFFSIVSLPFMGWKRMQAARLLQDGSRGTGVVLAVEDTGVTINNNPRVRLRFRIEPEDGITPPFEASKTATVSRVNLPRPGDRYPVWYDPNDRDKWMFATGNVEALTGQQPALRKIVELARQGAQPTVPAPQASEVVGELNRLNELQLAGKITPEEFASRTAALLRGNTL